MLYSIKDREDLENLEELASLQDQVKVVKLQDKLGEQNFHEDIKKVFEPVTKSFENASEILTKAITESSKDNNLALENLEEIVSLENQVKAVRLQDKLGKQNFHEDMKKIFEPVTKSLKDVSEEVTKTVTENSIKNKQALENLNNKLLEIMNDRGIISS